MLTRNPFPVAAAEERRLDRRRFLGVAGCAALLACAGEWLGHNEAAPPQLELGPVDTASLARGEARIVPAARGDGEALVLRLVTGEVVAFDRRCPHLGCPVVWAAARQQFECPCHRAVFDGRTGRVLAGPPRRALTPAVVRSV
jgi:Rieske Fe-S protein